MPAIVRSPVVVPAKAASKVETLDWRPGMAMAVQEIYNATVCAANATTAVVPVAGSFGGFLATAAGTFTLQDNNGNTLIPQFTVAAGQFVVGGFVCPAGGKVITGSGCTGTALYSGTIS